VNGFKEGYHEGEGERCELQKNQTGWTYIKKKREGKKSIVETQWARGESRELAHPLRERGTRTVRLKCRGRWGGEVFTVVSLRKDETIKQGLLSLEERASPP